MTHPLLSRQHLEALLIAAAIMYRDQSVWLHDHVDRDRISPAAWALLEQLVLQYPDDVFVDVRAQSKTQQQLLDDVGFLTFNDLFAYSRDELLWLVNRLPERVKAIPAWERHLQTLHEAVA